MADIRPKDLLPTAESMAEDDYLLLDGATQGIRKILANTAVEVARIETANGAPGAVPRSLRSKLSETLSVADFGAVGDGVADDRAALLAALANGESFSIGGTLMITGPVTPGDEITIRGGKIYQSVETENAVQLTSSGTDVHLRDLTIEYPLPIGWDFAVGPNGRGISGPAPDGAPARSLDYFENMTFINPNKQAYADFNGSTYTRLIGCRIFNCGRDGFVVSGTTLGTIVAQCILENTGDDAIAFNGDSSHCIGIGNVLKNVGLVGPLTGIPHNLVAAGTAFKVHGKHITIVGNAIKDVYTAFLSVKPNNFNSVDGLNSPDNIIFANNVCQGVYEVLEGASTSTQVCVQTMTGNSNRAATIGRIIVANNTFQVDPAVNAVCSFFRNRHPTKVVHLNHNMARGVRRCFSIEDHLETLVVNGGYYEYTDVAANFVADLAAAETALVNRIEINGGEYRRPTGSNVEFIRTDENIDIDELIVRGIRVYGNHNDLLRLRGTSHVDTIRLEDCLKNDAPFYSMTLFDTATYNHLFINGVEHITTVASAAAGDGNTTLVTGAEFGKRYAIKISETVAFDGNTSKTFRLGTSAGDDSLLGAVTATGTAEAIVYVDGAGQNIVLSWTNNANATAGTLTVTVKVMG